jgi:hypothetical protein
MKAIVIKPGEQPEVKELNPEDGIKAELGGGWLEGLRFADNAHAFIDEEGKEKELPVNELATQLCTKYGVGLAESDVIVGTFIIVGTLNEDGEAGGDEHDVPSLLIEQITASEWGQGKV